MLATHIFRIINNFLAKHFKTLSLVPMYIQFLLPVFCCYNFSHHLTNFLNLIMCVIDNGNDLPTCIPFLEISDEKHDSNK